MMNIIVPQCFILRDSVYLRWAKFIKMKLGCSVQNNEVDFQIMHAITPDSSLGLNRNPNCILHF